jgi:hypothetical protein
MRACMHTYMHACMHTYIHTHIHTYTHTHTHTHTRHEDIPIALLDDLRGLSLVERERRLEGNIAITQNVERHRDYQTICLNRLTIVTHHAAAPAGACQKFSKVSACVNSIGI